jgi:hypothetical protein
VREQGNISCNKIEDTSYLLTPDSLRLIEEGRGEEITENAEQSFKNFYILRR